ncbi:MAG: YceI family protein [Sphingomonadaceae bacterium]|nr:YceI family protein [Sphingomonadaceae bacterium]
MKLILATAVAAATAFAVPAMAQMAVPGAPDIARVAAGTYAADPRHTQVEWRINHFGFSEYDGIFGNATGTLTLDPAHPAAAAVAIEVPVSGLVTTVAALDTHLKSPDFFDAAKFPAVTFKSTRVTFAGTNATITGDLTLHGVTKTVTLAAHLIGAGANPMSKKATIGFAATATIKRSDFGMTMLLPALGDTVDLRINAAFERIN